MDTDLRYQTERRFSLRANPGPRRRKSPSSRAGCEDRSRRCRSLAGGRSLLRAAVETQLSNHSKKTCDVEKYKQYVTKKNETNNKLDKHYAQPLFRKLKLNTFINTQKSESKMIKNLKNKFDPMSTNNIMIVMGDYDKGNHNMRNKEPTICKKFRRIFKNAGSETYLVLMNLEHLNYAMNAMKKLEKFMIRESHKPMKYKNEETNCSMVYSDANL